MSCSVQQQNCVFIWVKARRLPGWLQKLGGGGEFPQNIFRTKKKDFSKTMFRKQDKFRKQIHFKN